MPSGSPPCVSAPVFEGRRRAGQGRRLQARRLASARIRLRPAEGADRPVGREAGGGEAGERGGEVGGGGDPAGGVAAEDVDELQAGGLDGAVADEGGEAVDLVRVAEDVLDGDARLGAEGEEAARDRCVGLGGDLAERDRDGGPAQGLDEGAPESRSSRLPSGRVRWRISPTPATASARRRSHASGPAVAASATARSRASALPAARRRLSVASRPDRIGSARRRDRPRAG